MTPPKARTVGIGLGSVVAEDDDAVGGQPIDVRLIFDGDAGSHAVDATSGAPAVRMYTLANRTVDVDTVYNRVGRSAPGGR